MKFMMLFFMCISTLSFGQNATTPGDTVFNQTDKQGLKQGYWKGYYENNKVKYIGFFKDNKPLGTLKRYYEDGIIKAVMVYDKGGIRIHSTLYYQNGTRAAEGNYMGTLKDSIWNYYSYYQKNISNREQYIKGKKVGVSVSYYQSGQISQELEFKNDIRDGKWIQYFENGNIKLQTTYIDGKRTGEFTLYYPNKVVEWKGAYTEDKKNGIWIHYNPDGSTDTQIEFVNGIAKNAEELDKKEQEILKLIEKKKGTIPEPEENDFVPGPGM